MAYTTLQTVSGWCPNLTINNPTANLSSLYDLAQPLADAQLDSDLDTYFYWPYNPQQVLINNPPPSLIVHCATLLTASIIENISYSQMMSMHDKGEDGGMGGTTYGRMLHTMYRTQVNRLIRGQSTIDALVRYGSVSMANRCADFHLQYGLAYDALLTDNDGYNGLVLQNPSCNPNQNGPLSPENYVVPPSSE